MAAKDLPPQDILRQLLRYEPETGKLFWLERTGGKRPNYFNSRFMGREAFGCESADGYKFGRLSGKNYQAHRIIWKLVYGYDPECIDHVNQVKNDNRVANLRDATALQNSRNYKKIGHFTSKYRGVCWGRRDGRWIASISLGKGKKLSIGGFAAEIDAAIAYDEAARKNHGEFAVLNFPTHQARIIACLVTP